MLRSASVQGWRVYLGVSTSWPGLVHVYRKTVQLLAHVVRSEAVRVTILYVDSGDSIVQQPPAVVAQEMAARGDSFVWSAEDGCFPLGGWPYNLGLGDYVCETLFPRPCDPLVPADNRYANGGGFVAASVTAANASLHTLHGAVERARAFAPLFGNQLFANTHFLRGDAAIDVDARIFAAGRTRAALSLRRFPRKPASRHARTQSAAGHALDRSSELAYCLSDSSASRFVCPTVLHFNGVKTGLARTLRELSAGWTAARRKRASAPVVIDLDTDERVAPYSRMPRSCYEP